MALFGKKTDNKMTTGLGGEGVEKFAPENLGPIIRNEKFSPMGRNSKANVLATLFDPMSDFSLKAFVDDGVFSENIRPDVFRVKD